MHPAVSVVIPGARNEEQVRGNVAAAGVLPLDDEIRQLVHPSDNGVTPGPVTG